MKPTPIRRPHSAIPRAAVHAPRAVILALAVALSVSACEPSTPSEEAQQPPTTADASTAASPSTAAEVTEEASTGSPPAAETPADFPALTDANGREIDVEALLDSADAEPLELANTWVASRELVRFAHLSCDATLTSLWSGGEPAGEAAGIVEYGVDITTAEATEVFEHAGSPGPVPAIGDRTVVLFEESGDSMDPRQVISLIDEEGGPRVIHDRPVGSTDPTQWPHGAVAADGGIWLQGTTFDRATGELLAMPIAEIGRDGTDPVVRAESGQLLGPSDSGVITAVTAFTPGGPTWPGFDVSRVTRAGTEKILTGSHDGSEDADLTIGPALAAESGTTLALQLHELEGFLPHLLVLDDGAATVIQLGGPARSLSVTEGWVAWTEVTLDSYEPRDQFLYDVTAGTVHRLGPGTDAVGLPSVCGEQIAWGAPGGAIQVGTLP